MASWTSSKDPNPEPELRCNCCCVKKAHKCANVHTRETQKLKLASEEEPSCCINLLIVQICAKVIIVNTTLTTTQAVIRLTSSQERVPLSFLMVQGDSTCRGETH